MLRVEVHDSSNSLRLKFEGRFTGIDAENTRTLLTRCREGASLLVDLTDVTFIDSTGEEVLSFFGRFGAEFTASTSYILDFCERLHLRLAGDGASNANTSGDSRTNGRRFRAVTRQPKDKKI